MGFYKKEDSEDCDYFFLTCDICGKEAEGNSLELTDKGWEFSEIKAEGTDNMSGQKVLMIERTATCPEHKSKHESLVINKMYNTESDPKR